VDEDFEMIANCSERQGPRFHLNFLDPYFVFIYTYYKHCHRATAHLQFIIIIIIIIIISKYN
jgi:hypothetical protein